MASGLLAAAGSGDLARVQALLEMGLADIAEVSDRGCSAVHYSAGGGHLLTLQWLVHYSGGHQLTQVDFNGANVLLHAARNGRLSTVQWIVSLGVISVTEVDNDGNNAALLAAWKGHLPTLQWLLAESEAVVTAFNNEGNTALLLAAYGASAYGDAVTVPTIQWLLEYGSANIAEENFAGQTVWDLLRLFFMRSANKDSLALTALLQVMVLLVAPPVELVTRLAARDARLVEDGARLRAGLPAYLKRRRALIDSCCPLIAPLCNLVHGYEVPTTTEELWATGVGAAR
jgi:ankyrin repeat protein